MDLKFQNYSDQDGSVKISDAKVYLRKRYYVTFLILLDWIVLCFMQMNLGISMVDMTSNKTVTIGNETFVKEPEFHWSSKEQGVLLGALSVGLLAAPLGSPLINKYGSIVTFTAATAGTGFLTILTPAMLSWSPIVYLVARVAEGISEGIAIMAVVDVLRLWSVPSERNRLFAAVPAGITLGGMLTFPVCGTIIHLLNWRAVFYITGSLSVVWSIIWFSLVRIPEKDKLMSEKERRYILAANKYISASKVTYPWREIFKSKAVWAYWNDRFVEAWSTAFLTASLPLYIKDVHDVDIQDIGFICGIPQFCGVVGITGGSILADFLRKHAILSTSNIHRLYLTFSQLVAVVLLIAAALWKNFISNIIIFSIFRLCFSLVCTSYMVIPVELGGQYGPVIKAFGATTYGLGAALSPVIMGLIVTDHSAFKWSIYFAVLSLFNLWGAIVFYKYGSASLQAWAVPPDNTAVYDTDSEKMSKAPLKLDIN